MKKTINLFYMLLLIGIVGFVSSCKDEEDAPVITFPDTGNPISLTSGESDDFTFTVVAKGGYVSHQLTAAGGTLIENPTVIPSGETDFTISGKYTAGDVTGPGAVTLTVTDGNGKSTTASISYTIVAPS